VTSNGTDVFVVGEDAGFGGTVAMVSFANPIAPKLMDKAEGKGSISEAVAYYKGYLYTGTDLTAWRVIPSSSIPPISSIDFVNEEQQLNSSVVDQIIDQITTLWKKVFNYFIRHFPIQV
jgi:hypothetical protein